MAISRVKIRKQIERAIAQLPQTVSLYRDVRIGPEEDYIEEKHLIATFDSFLDRSKSRMKSVKSVKGPNEGNVEVVAQVGLLLVWTPDFVIKKDDYFMLDGLRHMVAYPKNNYDIYWDCDVEVYQNG